MSILVENQNKITNKETKKLTLKKSLRSCVAVICNCCHTILFCLFICIAVFSVDEVFVFVFVLTINK